MARTTHQSINTRHQFLTEQFQQIANPQKAEKFQAYLKTNQAMFGINAGPRKSLLNQALKDAPILDQEDYNQTILHFWRQPQRDFQYCAIDTAIKYKRRHTMDSWETFEALALTAKWWDLTDSIAVNLIGSLLLKNRGLQDVMDIWAQDQDRWVRRTSLLAHLKHKDDADFDAIAKTILTVAVDKQFFIQKAIGWVLREYSKRKPSWVLEFLDQHIDALSPLAIREGCKYLND